MRQYRSLIIKGALITLLCFPTVVYAAMGPMTKSKAIKDALDQFETPPSQHTFQTVSSQSQQQSPSEIEISQANESAQEGENVSRLAKVANANPPADISREEFFRKHTVQIGPEVSYIEYKEPDIMKETGMMYGLAGSYAYHDAIMAKIDGRFAYGQVDYKNSGEIKDIDDYLGEARVLLGYDFLISEASALTPYLGAGYRYLNDDMSGKTSTTGASGYERESHYLYSPIGLEGLVRLGDGWAIGGSVEYDYFWWGKQISHLSDVNSVFNDIENRQKKGYGVRGSLLLLKKGEQIDFLFEPFIRYWSIKQSETSDWTANGTVIGYGYEPENKSTEFGAKLALQF